MASISRLFIEKKYDARMERRIRKKIQEKEEKLLLAEVLAAFPYSKEELQAFLREYWHDPIALELLRKIYTSVLYVPEMRGISHRRRFLTRFGDVELLAHGSVPVFANEYFVVKSSGYSHHEYIIGAYALNSLRQYIPNFAAVLGRFRCSRPFEGSICQHDEGLVPYVIYERINGGIPLHTFVETCTFTEYLNILVQLLLSLALAHEYYAYTHNDLHGKNVLIVTLQKPVTICYPLQEEQINIRTQTLAVIIDYGFSTACIAGEWYAHINYRQELYEHSSQPIRDIFRILTTTIFHRYIHAKDLFPRTLDLFRPFFQIKLSDEELFPLVLQLLRKKRGILPRMEEDIPFLEYFAYLKTFPEVESCIEDTCTEEKEELSSPSLPLHTEDDVFLWYDQGCDTLPTEKGAKYLAQLRLAYTQLCEKKERGIAKEMLFLKDLCDLHLIGKELARSFPTREYRRFVNILFADLKIYSPRILEKYQIYSKYDLVARDALAPPPLPRCCIIF